MAFWKRPSGKLLAFLPSAVVSFNELDSGNTEVTLANGHLFKLKTAEAVALLGHLEGVAEVPLHDVRYDKKPGDDLRRVTEVGQTQPPTVDPDWETGSQFAGGTRNYGPGEKTLGGLHGLPEQSLFVPAKGTAVPGGFATDAPKECPVTTLPSAALGQFYSQAVIVECPAGPLVTPGNFHVTAGSLPSGLTLDINSGVISGTPTATGLSTFTIAANGLNATGCHDFTLAVS